jgi:hypothetical protein
MRRYNTITACPAAIDECDAGITDPGAVDDGALDVELSQPALVNGMTKALARALGYVAYTGGAVSREIVASGSQTLFGITQKQRLGLLDPAVNETNDHWLFAQQARWVAEDGVRRMRATSGEKFKASALAAEALLYVGYSNRLLGENMCDAVIDAGPKQPRRVYFERAQAAFGEAATIAQASGNENLLNAARAGRASVRIWLDDWNGAVSDAALVPASFVFQVKFDAANLDFYNRIFWANSNQPYRAHSVVGTFYENYYKTTNDPRTPWKTNPLVPTGTVGNVPWLFQVKYDKRESPITLSSGREMRLIAAESMLRSGDWQGALSVINQVRAGLSVPAWTASSSTEAWVALKRERGIQLWLEGRRLGDLDRWLAAGTPGAVEDMTGRNTCYPIGQTEIESNPNL